MTGNGVEHGPVPPLRIDLVQFRPKKADVSGNLERIRDEWLSHGQDADIVVFPEAALTGYFLEGGVEHAAVTVEDVARGLGRPPGGGHAVASPDASGDPSIGARDGSLARSPTVILGFYEKWQRGI